MTYMKEEREVMRNLIETEKEQDKFNASSARLRSFVDRVERLNEERDALTEDISEVLNEAAGEGYDKPILKKLVAMRKKDPSKLAEEEAIMDTYKTALGME